MKHKKDIIFLFIITIPISAMMIYWLVSEQDYDMLPFVLIPQLCVIPVIVLMILKEKLIMAVSRKIQSRPESDRRQEALENFETDSFRNITAETMSADLKSIYRRKFAPRCLLLGTICMLVAAFMVAYILLDQDNSILTRIFYIVVAIYSCLFGFCGISLIIESVLQVTGVHVKSFENKNRDELDMIERSYMSGRMMVAPNSGLNIGIDFIIYLDWYKCECIRISDVSSVNALCIRTTGHGKSGFIKEQKYEYNIIVDVIGRKKPIKYIANELQSEYIRDEFARRGIYAIRNYCEKEKYL